MTQLEIMGAAAKKASRFLMNAGFRKGEALLAIAKALRENSAAIIAANDIDIENGKVHGVAFEGGCAGNTKGVAALVEGMDVEEAIKRLEGIRCGFKTTSCPDQLAKALRQVTEE